MARGKKTPKPMVISLPQAHFMRGVLSVADRKCCPPIADYMRITPRYGFGVVFTGLEQDGKVVRFLAVHSDDWFKTQLESIPHVVSQLVGLKDRLFAEGGRGLTAHYVCSKGYDLEVSLAAESLAQAGVKPDRSIFYQGNRLILLDMHAGQIVTAAAARGIVRTPPVASSQKVVQRHRNDAEARKILPRDAAFNMLFCLAYGHDVKVSDSDLVAAPLRELYPSCYGRQPLRRSKKVAVRAAAMI